MLRNIALATLLLGVMGCSTPGSVMAPSQAGAPPQTPAVPTPTDPLRARCCLTVDPEGKEERLDPTSHSLPPGTRTLRLHAQSAKGHRAVMVVAGFGAPDHVLKAEFCRLDPLESPADLRWSIQKPPAIKLFVAFLDPGHTQAAAIKQVLEQWSKDQKGDGPAARRLFGELSGWYGSNPFGMGRSSSVPEEAGGVQWTLVSSDESGGAGLPKVHQQRAIAPTGKPDRPAEPPFDWLSVAERVAFGPGQPGVVIYDIGQAQP